MPFQKGNKLASKRIGKKYKKTLDKEAVLKAYRERVMKSTNRLLDYQFSVAKGMTYLFKIEKKCIVGRKGGKKYVSKKPKLVTDVEEISKYLEGLVESGNPNDHADPSSTYYYMVEKAPDHTVIKDIFDRAFGKAPQSVQLQGDDGKSLPITQINLVPVQVKK